jgi:hypothetical protein
MAIDVSYRDTFTTSAEDLARTNRNFIINEGVAFDGLKVTQSGTPAMTVAVATGTGYFYGSGTNANVMYEFYSDASETVTIGTAGVQARIDIICLKVDASTGVASIVAVAGTPSGSPAVPATPASHYKLAEVAVGISVTTITNANITDTRRSVFVAPTGARNQGLINGKIVPTVASNNLTVAIKTLTDTDPTPTNPVGIWIGNNLRWITGALNSSFNAGANGFNSGSSELATREIDYFVYIGKLTTGGGLELGFARIPYAKLGSDFSTSATNEKYARFSASATSPANFTEAINIGRFAATLSAGAGYTWTVPAFTNANLIQEPIYETRWLDYLPTYSTGGAGTYTSVTTAQAKYRLMSEKAIEIILFARGTTNSVDKVRASIPFGYNLNGGTGSYPNQFLRFPAMYADGGTETVGVAQINNGTGNTIEWRNAWTNGANRDIEFNGILPLT